jgi:hypothetical protein
VAERDAAGAEQRLRQATELYGRSDPPVEGRAALLLATVLRMQGHLDEARALLGRFRTAEGPGVDRIVRAEALAQLGAELMRGDEPSSASSALARSSRALLDQFRRREDREALGEARHICEELGASSWLSALEPTSKVVT